jgi:hypothetical protein
LDLALAGDRLLAGAWTGIYSAPAYCKEKGGDWVYLSPSLGIPYAQAILSAEAGLLLGTRAGLFRWSPNERRWLKLLLQHPQTGDAPPGGVTVLRAAPTNPLVIYAGTAASGLYRASPSSAPVGSVPRDGDDRGENWARVPTDLEVGVRDLAISPVDENHLFMVAAWERVYQSRDGGRRWQAQWTGLGVSTEIISLAIDPLNPATLYLGDEAGLYRSRYGGEDWQTVGHPLDGQTILTIQARPLAVDHTRQAPQRETDALPLDAEGGASVLYIGATRGVYRSFDGGQTVERWGEGLEDISVTALLFDPDDARSVYAGTAYAGLYHSPDGGETWKPMDGPPELMDDVVEGMAWGPEGDLFVAASGGVWVGTN